VVDHGQLGAVGGPDLATLALGERSLRHPVHRVGRPDQVRALPVRVVEAGVGLGRVEGLMGVELVDRRKERSW